MITEANPTPVILPSTDELTLIVKRAQAGDERAFEALYAMHAPRIHALSLRMTRSYAAAEDALQDVFLRAWRSLAQFRGDCTFGTWLHQIATRVLIDRHRRSRPEDQHQDFERPFSGEVPGANVDLERAIGTLPGRARMALLLAAAGYRYDEIATLMGTETGTVKSQIHRARRLVREALQ